jgi:hypothetical protein
MLYEIERLEFSGLAINQMLKVIKIMIITQLNYLFSNGFILNRQVEVIDRRIRRLIYNFTEKNDQCGQPCVTRKCGARTDGQRLTRTRSRCSVGCSSLFSKRELSENAKKNFWLLWKHFRRKGMKEISRRKKRRRKYQVMMFNKIFNYKKMFLFKTHQKEAEFVSAIELNDFQIAGTIKTFDIGEIFRKSDLQWPKMRCLNSNEISYIIILLF